MQDPFWHQVQFPRQLVLRALGLTRPWGSTMCRWYYGDVGQMEHQCLEWWSSQPHRRTMETHENEEPKNKEPKQSVPIVILETWWRTGWALSWSHVNRRSASHNILQRQFKNMDKGSKSELAFLWGHQPRDWGEHRLGNKDGFSIQ